VSRRWRCARESGSYEIDARVLEEGEHGSRGYLGRELDDGLEMQRAQEREVHGVDRSATKDARFDATERRRHTQLLHPIEWNPRLGVAIDGGLRSGGR